MSLSDERKAQMRAYHQTHKDDPKYIQKRKDTANQARQDKLNWIRQYKLDQGCSICGYNKCARALEFHHIDPNVKEYSVTKMALRKHSLQRIKTEIAKCVIVCANCHAEIHD
jgi:hypothetical protein